MEARGKEVEIMSQWTQRKGLVVKSGEGKNRLNRDKQEDDFERGVRKLEGLKKSGFPAVASLVTA